METSFTSISGARAYQSAKKLQVQDVARSDFATPTPKASFADMVEATAKDAVQTIRQGEAAAVAGLQGTMPMQKVVEATMAMESALKVTVSLRDRVVEAYQEIMRMSV